MNESTGKIKAEVQRPKDPLLHKFCESLLGNDGFKLTEEEKETLSKSHEARSRCPDINQL